MALLRDGSICVADAGLGGVMIFSADGNPVKLLAGVGGGAPGGNIDVVAAPDDTLWVAVSYM